ncbi:MAG TPA: DUF4184 family protein [Steroidobacteraceae bacterium]|jgi:membrane-bound metal-dependent hydrolase YbcI (DUF457 family)|nr:DUF4184 family protein [Steroidobacteraceae bacterium]
MPFTVSHAAAVLPLQRWSRYRLPLTALMVGSMAPDFGYVFSYEASRALTHSFSGLFVFSLPVGLVVWLFYVAVLEKATITLLSERWHTRFAHTEAITIPLVLRAALAIVLGAATHLLWDSFTHRGTFATDAIPALLAPTPGFAWLPIYHVLHGLSSVVGLVILAAWMRRLQRQPARSLVRPYEVGEQALAIARWSLVAAFVLGGAWAWLPYAHSRYDQQLFYAAVGSMSGFFAAWCAIALALRVFARRKLAP